MDIDALERPLRRGIDLCESTFLLVFIDSSASFTVTSEAAAKATPKVGGCCNTVTMDVTFGLDGLSMASRDIGFYCLCCCSYSEAQYVDKHCQIRSRCCAPYPFELQAHRLQDL